MHVLQKIHLIFSFGNYKVASYSFLSLGTIHLYFDPNGCPPYLFNVPELEPAVDDRLLLRAGLFSHQLPTLRLSLWLSQWTRLSYTACGRVVTSFRHPALRTKPDDLAREKPQRFDSYKCLRTLKVERNNYHGPSEKNLISLQNILVNLLKSVYLFKLAGLDGTLTGSKESTWRDA